MAKRRVKLQVEVDIEISESNLAIYKDEGVNEDDAFDTVLEGISVEVFTTDEAMVDVACWSEQ